MKDIFFLRRILLAQKLFFLQPFKDTILLPFISFISVENQLQDPGKLALGPSFLWVGTTELGVREIQKQSNLFRMGK
jgi:hypothetical protein